MKKLAFAITVVALIGVAASIWWYQISAREVAERWVACGTTTSKKSLLTARDQLFADEAEQDTPAETKLIEEACLAKSEIVGISLNGRQGSLIVNTKYPTLTWDEMTRFPATATKSDKIRILQERVTRAGKYSESKTDIGLRFEALQWRIHLNLEPHVLLRRRFAAATKERQARNWTEALAIYESVANDASTPEIMKGYAEESRLAALAEKACYVAARQYIKYADAAEYTLSGYGSPNEAGPISVTGFVNAPNAFGVKSKIATMCKVSFQEGSAAAYVDLFMVPPSGSDVVDKKRIEVKI